MGDIAKALNERERLTPRSGIWHNIIILNLLIQ